MMKTLSRNLIEGPATLMHPKRERVFTKITRDRFKTISTPAFRADYAVSGVRLTPSWFLRKPKEWQIDRLKCCVCRSLC